MEINISNIEVLSTIDRRYAFFKENIVSKIKTNNQTISELVNDNVINQEIAINHFGAVLIEGAISYPSFASIENTKYFNDILEIYKIYEKLITEPSLLEIGSMKAAINDSGIYVVGDAPIEKYSNIVYNLVALKCLLDFKRSENGK